MNILLPSIVVLSMWVCFVASVRTSNTTKFPDDFLFGAATSAFQVEGAWNVSGRGPSNFDSLFVRYFPEILAEDACRSYHNYKRDVEMTTDIGLDFYRFSISWSRLFPTGFTNQVNEDGFKYYNNLINELVAHNVKPMVTLMHFDLPQYLQNLGGMTNPLFVEWFSDYAEFVFEKFGDRVKHWYTINELELFCLFGYSGMTFPPGVNAAGIGEYNCIYNGIKAHAIVYRMYDKQFSNKQKGKIGITHALPWPADNDPKYAPEERAFKEFWFGIIADPLYSSGDFPNFVKERVANKSAAQGFKRSRLPIITLDDQELLRGAFDFIGIAYYSRILIADKGKNQVRPQIPSFFDDIGMPFDIRVMRTDQGRDYFIPDVEHLRDVLNFIKKRYNNPEVIISENGISTSIGLEDESRVQFIRKSLNIVLKAINEDGCRVSGYTIWSLMDSFERSIRKYRIRFGLYEVDFSDPERKRTPRKSALIYKQIIKDRKIDWNYNPKNLNIAPKLQLY